MRDSFSLAGQNYTLRHLRGFRVCLPANELLKVPVKLQVTFSCHVYSEKWDAGLHDPANHFVDDQQERAFCPVRYGCSIKLEQIIKANLEGKVFWSKDGNGVANPFFYGGADGIPYPVYFNLGKAERINGVHGLMHIISAYQNPNLPARNRFQAIKFARLVHQKCK